MNERRAIFIIISSISVRSLLALALALALPACSHTTPHQAAGDRLTAALDSDKQQVHRHAIIQLANDFSYAPRLVQALEHANPEVRANAAWALRLTTPDEALGPLMQMLRKRANDHALDVLDRYKPARLRQIAEQLEPHLQNADSRVRVRVADLLKGCLDTARMRRIFAHPDPAVRANLVRNLESADDAQVAREIASAAANDPSTTVRIAAACSPAVPLAKLSRLLQQLLPPEFGQSAFFRPSPDSDVWPVLETYLYVIMRRVNEAGPDDVSQIPALLAQLVDPSTLPGYRGWILAALQSMGRLAASSARAVLDLATQPDTETRQPVRAAARRAVGYIATLQQPDVIRHLQDLAATQPWAAVALARIGDASALGFLVQHAPTDVESTRMLGWFRSPRVIAPLAAVLRQQWDSHSEPHLIAAVCAAVQSAPTGSVELAELLAHQMVGMPRDAETFAGHGKLARVADAMQTALALQGRAGVLAAIAVCRQIADDITLGAVDARKRFAAVLGQAADAAPNQAVSALAQLAAADRDPRVREAAVNALMVAWQCSITSRGTVQAAIQQVAGNEYTAALRLVAVGWLTGRDPELARPHIAFVRDLMEQESRRDLAPDAGRVLGRLGDVDYLITRFDQLLHDMKDHFGWTRSPSGELVWHIAINPEQFDCWNAPPPDPVGDDLRRQADALQCALSVMSQADAGRLRDAVEKVLPELRVTVDELPYSFPGLFFHALNPPADFGEPEPDPEPAKPAPPPVDLRQLTRELQLGSVDQRADAATELGIQAAAHPHGARADAAIHALMWAMDDPHDRVRSLAWSALRHLGPRAARSVAFAPQQEAGAMLYGSFWTSGLPELELRGMVKPAND